MTKSHNHTDELVYLVQTDTTVGFLSQSSSRLGQIKQRSEDKRFLQNCSSFATLKSKVRVPNIHKKRVRNSKKSTFVYPNNSLNHSLSSIGIRVIKETKFNLFLDRFDILYSTSANLSGEKYDEKFAYQNADIIVENGNGFEDKTPSKLYKLYKNKIIKIR
jgi:tRNA A37 threonylcarbamoyladenosine synthetase subunit TsaC/SUA5/YrdC